MRFFVFLVLACGCAAQTQAGIRAANVATYLGGDKWEWTVYLQGPPEQLASIARVEYLAGANGSPRISAKLGDSKRPWEMSGTAYGTLDVGIRIFFKDGTVQRLNYPLKFDAVPAADKCPAPFSLHSLHYQLLNDPVFRKQVYIYVDEIHTDWRRNPFRMTVFVGDTSWSDEGNLNRMQFANRPKGEHWTLMPREEGDMIQFRFYGRFYSLTLLKVNVGLGQDNYLLAKICALASSAY